MTSNNNSADDGPSDGNDEDQDEPSSSLDETIVQQMNQVAVQNEEQTVDALASFRQQWHREIESSPKHQQNVTQYTENEDVSQKLSDEEMAKVLFLEGVENEQKGKHYEAIKCYKRAVQLVPDIEFKIYEKHKHKKTVENVFEDSKTIEKPITKTSKKSLYARIQKKMAKSVLLCTPEFETKAGHISWLPHELILLILRWVVSSDLDTVSLERFATVCRGFYIVARDPQIWQMICARTWGLNCGDLNEKMYKSWRQMYIERPRLKFNGCYISRTTYLRHGENSFQDQFYRPWFQIVYYRYLRFFPEGTVIMLTTADDPAVSVAQLRRRAVRANQGMSIGHYRLIGDRVLLEMKKQQQTDKSSAWTNNNRFRSRKKEIQDSHNEQLFHMEFRLCAHKSRLNCQLVWTSYSVYLKYKNGSESTLDFDLTPSKYPPLWFSGVKSYHATAEGPLT